MSIRRRIASMVAALVLVACVGPAAAQKAGGTAWKGAVEKSSKERYEVLDKVFEKYELKTGASSSTKDNRQMPEKGGSRGGSCDCTKDPNCAFYEPHCQSTR